MRGQLLRLVIVTVIITIALMATAVRCRHCPLPVETGASGTVLLFYYVTDRLGSIVGAYFGIALDSLVFGLPASFLFQRFVLKRNGARGLFFAAFVLSDALFIHNHCLDKERNPTLSDPYQEERQWAQLHLQMLETRRLNQLFFMEADFDQKDFKTPAVRVMASFYLMARKEINELISTVQSLSDFDRDSYCTVEGLQRMEFKIDKVQGAMNTLPGRFASMADSLRKDPNLADMPEGVRFSLLDGVSQGLAAPQPDLLAQANIAFADTKAFANFTRDHFQRYDCIDGKPVFGTWEEQQEFDRRQERVMKELADVILSSRNLRQTARVKGTNILKEYAP